jgi:selenocysteine lyase/cysteine desulfurase
MADVRTVAQAQQLFHPDGVYLNTATAGLPPDPSWEALQGSWSKFRAGTAQGPDYDEWVESARGHYARLAGVDLQRVAIGNQASVFVGTIAASLPDGAEILTATGDFTSVTFPFLAQQRQSHRRFTVREVPLPELAGAVTPTTTLVAVSAVQSADGAIADLPGIAAACAANDSLSLIDTTQSLGWYPLRTNDFDVTVTSGYKWLLAPRGTAFMTIRPELMDRIVPVAAGWYAGEERWSSIYGSPLRLASSARRYDISPAGHSWVGAAPSLELLADIGSAALHEHAVGLANAFRAGVGLPPGESAIVSLDLQPGAEQRVADARVTGAMRAGKLRLSFHLNTSADDVAAAVGALSGWISLSSAVPASRERRTRGRRT